MSDEQLKAFIVIVKRDSSLQQKLKAAADSDAVVAIAKEAGFTISVQNLEKTESEISEELSLQELESVAGGTLPTCNARDTWSTPPGGDLQDRISRGAGYSKKITGHNDKNSLENFKRDLGLF